MEYLHSIHKQGLDFGPQHWREERSPHILIYTVGFLFSFLIVSFTTQKFLILSKCDSTCLQSQHLRGRGRYTSEFMVSQGYIVRSYQKKPKNKFLILTKFSLSKYLVGSYLSPAPTWQQTALLSFSSKGLDVLF